MKSWLIFCLQTNNANNQFHTNNNTEITVFRPVTAW